MTWRRGIATAVSCVIVVSAPVTVGSSAAPSCAAEPQSDVAYRALDGVDPNLLSLDIYPVDGQCAAPVAVWIHGGGWRRGDKDNGAAQRASFYNANGWALVAINYRLVTDAADPPVQYPDFSVDAAAAIGWVESNIATFGGDPTRLVLVGHSAGGAISAAITADPAYLATHGLDPSVFDCVILLDTEGYEISEQTDTLGLFRLTFGDESNWVEASPLTHVGEGPLPARALVVTRGQPQRTAGSGRFAAALSGAGVAATAVDVNPLTHGEVNELIGSGDEVMTPLIEAELQVCGSSTAATGDATAVGR